jgi:hypothetical protein
MWKSPVKAESVEKPNPKEVKICGVGFTTMVCEGGIKAKLG